MTRRDAFEWVAAVVAAAAFFATIFAMHVGTEGETPVCEAEAMGAVCAEAREAFARGFFAVARAAGGALCSAETPAEAFSLGVAGDAPCWWATEPEQSASAIWTEVSE